MGRNGRAVSNVARGLGADWHAVNDAVIAYGQALLDADVDRVGAVDALGVDEVLFARLGRWREQIAAWHQAHVSNGPTEAVNNLVKRVKRVAFGFRRFTHDRIRALLYAGKPNWDLLPMVTPR